VDTIVSTGLSETATAVRGAIPLVTYMRTRPSVTVSSITHFKIYTTNGYNFTSGSIDGQSRVALGIFASTGGGMTGGQAGQILINSLSGFINVDAEL
jgi:hypothetical protein